MRSAPFFRNFSLLLLSLLTFGCTKTEVISNEQQALEILGKWHLVFSSGGKVEPVDYQRGEKTWTFDGQLVQIFDQASNTIESAPYRIVDTINETHLNLSNYYIGNIERMTKDSLFIDANKYLGCGGVKIFVR
jgi:hypothetical protein